LHSAQHSSACARASSRAFAYGPYRIGDLVSDGTDRIERGTRILEDHRHRRAMQMRKSPQILVMSARETGYGLL